MNNPYAPPTEAGRTPRSSARALADQIIVRTAKGDVVLAKEGSKISIEHQGKFESFAADTFVTKIGLVFWKMKQASFKPIRLQVQISDGDFDQLIAFYGAERYQKYDLRQARMMNLVLGVFLLGLGIFGIHEKPVVHDVDIALIVIGSLDLALYAMTLTPWYLMTYALHVVVNVLLAVLLGLNVYDHGGWWLFLLIFFVSIGAVSNFKKYCYFRALSKRQP